MSSDIRIRVNVNPDKSITIHISTLPSNPVSSSIREYQLTPPEILLLDEEINHIMDEYFQSERTVQEFIETEFQNLRELENENFSTTLSPRTLTKLDNAYENFKFNYNNSNNKL
jgi:hypothetical protein